MRPSLRFLVLAVVAWAGVRAATLGVVPGASILHVRPVGAHPVPAPAPSELAATEFPPIEPLPAAAAAEPPPLQQASIPMFPPGWLQALRALMTPARARVIHAEAPNPAQNYTAILPTPRPNFYAAMPQLDEWPLSRLASASHQPARSDTVIPLQSPVPAITRARLDRIQLGMWALLRSPQALAAPATQSLATGGMLGGSQAGARLFYNFTSQIAAVLRTSSDVGRRGGEVALGVRLHPLQSVPVWLTAERRQTLGSTGVGRNAFAVFAEGGVYDRQLPGDFLLNAYAQAGVVGARKRDLFADGAVTVSHPLYKQFSGGVGVWGGVQPGLYRVDVGPRVTMRVRNNVRIHFDWRQRVAGKALPGSGPAVTLAGDF